MLVERVPPYLVATTWPHVEYFIDSVQEFTSGEWTTSQIKADVLTGRCSLAVCTEDKVFKGACVYVMQNRRNSRTAFIQALGGAGVTKEENWKQLCALFKSEGATEVEAAMRPAALRLWGQLGFKEKYRITGAEL